jgi:hypothetical protein
MQWRRLQLSRIAARRLGRVLSLVGLLIIFVTFVIKDGLEHQWDEDSNAIDLAQHLFAIRSDTALILTRVNAAHDENQMERLEKLGYSVGESDDAVVDYETTRQMVNQFRADFDVADAQLRALVLLADTDPLPHSDMETLSGYVSRLQSDSDSVQEALVALVVAPLVASKSVENQSRYKRSLLDASHKAHEALDPALHDVSFANTAVPFFVNRVFHEAEREREKNRRLANLAKWCSGILYTVGWSITFMAALMGIKMETG